MKNKLIALAIAAAFTAPMAAQAGVKVGGHLQTEIADLDSDGTSNDKLVVDDNKRGRLWFTGSEDLGGGLKANYRYEWQVETATASLDGNRESRVGLSGSFGEVQIGRLKTPYKYTAGVNYDPYTATLLESRGNGGALKANGSMTAAFGQNSFLANSVAYKTKFGKSTKFWILYNFAEQASGSTIDDNISASLAVKINKSMGIDVAYIEENSGTNTGGSRAKVGFRWKSGAHKLFARYETQSDNAANSDFDSIFVGYNMSMGKNVLTLQYGTLDGDANSTSSAAQADTEYTMVAFAHNFSKKTKSWVGFRTTDSDTNSADQDVLSVGLRIKF